MAFTQDETAFLDRMAGHIDNGLSLNDAAQAVRDETNATMEKYWAMRPDERVALKAAISAQVWHRIREGVDINRALGLPLS